MNNLSMGSENLSGQTLSRREKKRAPRPRGRAPEILGSLLEKDVQRKRVTKKVTSRKLAIKVGE